MTAPLQALESPQDVAGRSLAASPCSTFRQKTARAESDVRCQCFAKPVLFLAWEKLPKSARDEFTNNGPIPCEGGGVPGAWCSGCRFGEVLEPEAV